MTTRDHLVELRAMENDSHKIGRDAGTGQFIPVKEALANPERATVETIKVGPNRLEVADQLYTTYCAGVGGKAWNDDPLPDWETFRADPAKKLQSDAWLAAADRAIEILR